MLDRMVPLLKHRQKTRPSMNRIGSPCTESHYPGTMQTSWATLPLASVDRRICFTAEILSEPKLGDPAPHTSVIDPDESRLLEPLGLRTGMCLHGTRP